MTYANNYTLEVPIMEFNQKELEYLLTCLNFHYAENDNIKDQLINLNSSILRKIADELYTLRGGK